MFRESLLAMSHDVTEIRFSLIDVSNADRLLMIGWDTSFSHAIN